MSTIIKAIRGARAYDLDQRLFNHYGFSLDQLMELAGLCYGSKYRYLLRSQLYGP